MGTKSLIFPFALEVHPGSQEYGQHHPPAQTVQPLPVSDCPDQLEVCGRSAEGMPQQGELWTLLNVNGYSLGSVRALGEGSCGVGSQKSVVFLWQH